MKKSTVKDKFDNLQKLILVTGPVLDVDSEEKEKEKTEPKTEPVESYVHSIEEINDNNPPPPPPPPGNIPTNTSYIYQSFVLTRILNTAKMEDYYETTLFHAKSSYIFAVIASCVGIGFFLFASFMVIFGNAAISSVIIPATGGAITEIIAGTIFLIYKKSLEQMNYYFDSLKSDENFFSSVDLIDRVSHGKDAIYCEIIKSRLNGAGSKP